MNIDNRVLVVVFVVLFIAVLFVFFIGQKERISFSEGVQEVNGLWVKNGFESGSFGGSEQKEISLEQLNALNGDLLLFEGFLDGFEQNNDVRALRDFVGIHLYVVEELKLALEIRKAKLELEKVADEDICFYFNDFKTLGENTILLNQQMGVVNDLIYSFSEEHSEFVNQSNLDSLIVDDAYFDLITHENQVILEQLKEVCG